MPKTGPSLTSGLLPPERELLLDIMKYGAGVEVIAPGNLRKAVKKELAEALAKY